ncbi:MAG: DNA repair protein RecN [Clostridium sp.]|jgi:DNA repair protein RecN (Recombination protein N)|nr:DNA repair protein RecN [Clostridium sp.]
MLESLRVKNLALLEEAQVEFHEGQNILTGETGAGKSLLLGAINLALGAKFDKDMLRHGAEFALVELTFRSKQERVTDCLRALDLPIDEEGEILLSRKLSATRNVYRVNGENISMKQVHELTQVLIDIHGQHDHQSLLFTKKHQEILDAYCGDALKKPLDQVATLYQEAKLLRQKIEAETLDSTALERQRAMAEYESQEIDAAQLKIGEDEELEKRFLILSNAQKIETSLKQALTYLSGDGENAANSISRSMKALNAVTSYDPQIASMEEELIQVEASLMDVTHALDRYAQELTFDHEEFTRIEQRLSVIEHLKNKYGPTPAHILAYLEQKQQELLKLADYETYMHSLKQSYLAKGEELTAACEVVSAIRRRVAKTLEKALQEAIFSLNFLTVDFEISIRRKEAITSQGFDEIEFLISTNPGESRKPLANVASGGELSRIMLAIKTVLASTDWIDTLIFDEIDAGISGKTAWKVSEQLHNLSKSHQVLCVTHLPQIAAMADHHFVIEKSATALSTITSIRPVDGEEEIQALARMLGGDQITAGAIDNAREMKQLAHEYKERQVGKT